MGRKKTYEKSYKENKKREAEAMTDRTKELIKEGSGIKREIETLISDCLFGLPIAAKTLTVRREYDPDNGGKWIDIKPCDGEGIKAIKKAMEEKWGIVPEKDFKVYSKEEEGDKILYIEFIEDLQTVTLEANIFEMAGGGGHDRK